jgi:hypothetical protein
MQQVILDYAPYFLRMFDYARKFSNREQTLRIS